MGPYTTVTKLSHVFTWWVWNAISVVTNKSPLSHNFIARKIHRIHNKHAHLPSFANQVLLLRRGEKNDNLDNNLNIDFLIRYPVKKLTNLGEPTHDKLPPRDFESEIQKTYS